MVKKLDDIDEISRLDSQDQFGMVADLPQHVSQAYAAAADLNLEQFGEVGGIAVAGMGGSAIGADIIKTAYEDQLGNPMVTVRGYSLPYWISSRSLVFAASYSGNTEETISCLNEALERGCSVICISSGGRVRDIAEKNDLPFIEVPSGLQPRAAMGWLSIPIAACLEGLGLIESVAGDVQEASGLLGQMAQLYGPGNPTKGNPAKQLAAAFENKVPVIYGAELTAVAAQRWKCQINENSKSLALANQFPELNHNEIMAWEHPATVIKDCAVIFLKDGGSHPQNHKRMDVTADLLGQTLGEIRSFETCGQSRLARLLSCTFLGDYVSLYMAILYGINPSPVDHIERLKKRLA